MWIMLNDAFVSIVSKDCKPDELMVRARRQGDIEKIFPGAAVTRFTKSDYLYRAPIKKDAIKAAMVEEIDRVVYSNFKSSVRDHDLHNAYLRVWTAMAALQEVKPYSGLDRNKSLTFFDSDEFFGEDPKPPAYTASVGKALADKPVKAIGKGAKNKAAR